MDCPAESFVERSSRLKTEHLKGARGIEPAPWLAFGFVGLPANLTLEAGKIADALCQILDGYLGAGTEVHGQRFVIANGGFDNSLGTIVHVEKFARSLARAPDVDELMALPPRCDTLADE